MTGARAGQPAVLVVEDEAAQMEMLAYNLEKAGFAVLRAADGEEGLLIARESEPALIVLDWMLPSVSGIEICRQLRRNPGTKAIPILMLTARGEETDLVRGLETGADDYMVKPYSVAELVARVRALLRRTSPASAGEILRYGDISLDPERHRVERAGRMLQLGPTEYRLLTVFMERPGRVWSRDQLLDRVWGRDSEIDFRAVDVTVGRLRRALHLPGHADPIRTVRGAGYALDLDG